MITTFIYILIEPSTKTVLYIGKTKDPIRRCTGWQKTYLYDCGFECEMILVDHIDHEESDRKAWGNLEKSWIKLFRETHEIYLANKHAGGTDWPIDLCSIGGKIGGKGHKGISLPTKGRKRPKEVGENISKALKGKPFTESHRQALFGNYLGIPKPKSSGKTRTEETRLKMSASSKGRKKSESHRLAIANANRIKKLARRLSVSFLEAKRIFYEKKGENGV